MKLNDAGNQVANAIAEFECLLTGTCLLFILNQMNWL